ncbi:hypothetical protein [Pantoea ananatis]|nr:hypothetical protein [Pantoea ananatis]
MKMKIKNALKEVRKKTISSMDKVFNLKQIGTIGNVYSVRTIVGRYLKYSNDGTINNRLVNVKGVSIPYTSFFKIIWEQDVTKLLETELIYYGWAYIDKYDKGYKIKFKKSFLGEDGGLLPVSFFISHKTIEKYPIKKLVITRLAGISSMAKPVGFVFIYGKPRIYTSPQSQKKYVNFDVFNLDFVDINKDSPMPKSH